MRRKARPTIEMMLYRALKVGYIKYVPSYNKPGEVTTLNVTHSNKKEAENLLRRLYL